MAMTEQLLTAVPRECPKCGRFTKGSYGEDLWAYGPCSYGEDSWAHGPTYNPATDALDYRCRQCGYAFSVPTQEARRG